MANITVIGNAIVIKSAETLENLKLIEKYMPKALILKEFDQQTGRSTDTFRVGFTSNGGGNINKYGVSFADTTNDPHGLATVTLIVDGDITNPVETVAEEFGFPLMKLNELEQNFEMCLENIRAQKEAILQNIVVA